MESRLIAVVVFVCAVCHLTGAQLFSVTALSTSITNTTCRTSKLCVSSVSGCDPAGNSSCFFSSTQYSNGVLTVEISGTTSGYVALEVTPTTPQTQLLTQGPVVLVCGNDNSNAFFEIATHTGSVLNPVRLTTTNITVQGSVTVNQSLNQSLTQCVFNIDLNSTFLSSALSNISFSTLLNSTLLNSTLLNSSLLTLFNSTLLNSSPFNSTLIPILNSTLVNSTLVTSTLLSLVNSSVLNSIKFNSTILSLYGPNPVSSNFLKFSFLSLFNQDSLLDYIDSTLLNSTQNLTQSNFPLGSLIQNYPLSNSSIYTLFNSTIFNSIVNSTVLSVPAQLPFNITILNGTTNGTQLGNASTVFTSSGPLNLANPRSNVPAPVPLNITRNGCNSTKLCLSSGSNCDPAGTGSCFFSSIQTTNQTFFFELSGTTSGYVALGLTKNGSTTVFVCGNNSYNFFFQPAAQNGSTLTPVTVNTVYNVVGVVLQNQTLIQCVFNTSATFNTSTSFSTSTKSADTSYQVTILNGNTNGTQLGSATTLYDTKTALDLSNPNALTTANPTANPTTTPNKSISSFCPN
ncbi:putative ferric-chelate reductase 1, partial [Clarias magur]